MQQARLFRFLGCTSGAYNQFHVHFLVRRDGANLMPVNFVVPELDIRYEDEHDDGGRSIDRRDRLYGAAGTGQFPPYDPDTLTMTAPFALARRGRCVRQRQVRSFRSAAFTLVRYDVDATLDGEINPETIIQLIDGGHRPGRVQELSDILAKACRGPRGPVPGGAGRQR